MAYRKHIENFGAGAGNAVSRMAFNSAKLVGHLSNAIAKRTTKDTRAGDALIRGANIGLATTKSMYGAGAKTKMGKAGALATAAVGSAVAVVGRAAAARAAQAATRSKAGKKAFETFKKNLVSKSRKRK